MPDNPNFAKFARAIAETEDASFNPNAHSKKGAMGIMQIEPDVAKEFGAADPYNPYQNINAGVGYLAQLFKKYNGNYTLAAAAYNAGPGAVDEYHGNYQLAAAAYNAGTGNVAKYHGIPPFHQTENYVKKVDALMADLENGDGSNVINDYYNYS